MLKYFTKKTGFLALGIALLYICLSVYAMNRAIILSTLQGTFPISYKYILLKSLFINSWAMYQPIEAVLLVCIAALMGINIALMGQLFTRMRGGNGLKMSFGGSSLFAIASAGCPSCGISVLSLVGISTPLLPLQGVPLQTLSVILLIGSIGYTLYRLSKSTVCQIELPKTTLQAL